MPGRGSVSLRVGIMASRSLKNTWMRFFCSRGWGWSSLRFGVRRLAAAFMLGASSQPKYSGGKPPHSKLFAMDRDLRFQRLQALRQFHQTHELGAVALLILATRFLGQLHDLFQAILSGVLTAAQDLSEGRHRRGEAEVVAGLFQLARQAAFQRILQQLALGRFRVFVAQLEPGEFLVLGAGFGFIPVP